MFEERWLPMSNKEQQAQVTLYNKYEQASRQLFACYQTASIEEIERMLKETDRHWDVYRQRWESWKQNVSCVQTHNGEDKK